MSTTPATIEHMLDTIPLTLTVKKMFGEYALYLDGVVVAFVCDDTLFIKPTPRRACCPAGCAARPRLPRQQRLYHRLGSAG